MKHAFFHLLYVASMSSTRHQLLREAQIPFMVIHQSADEHACDRQKPFLAVLHTIALHKMEQLILAPGHEAEVRFVLTADTMGCDSNGSIHGKPVDKEDAICKIKALRKGGVVATAFCLDKRIWTGAQWDIQERVVETVSTSYVFDMPDAKIERYLEVVPYYKDISGAITVEGFGAQFLKEIQGSYTTILGLPMFELRVVLEQLGFFD